jgi:hypothetical protein
VTSARRPATGFKIQNQDLGLKKEQKRSKKFESEKKDPQRLVGSSPLRSAPVIIIIIITLLSHFESQPSHRIGDYIYICFSKTSFFGTFCNHMFSTTPLLVGGFLDKKR